MTVNALVTGLIVFKISKVFQEVRVTVDQILGGTRGGALRRVLLVIIESGMVLFSVQLARLVAVIVEVIMPSNRNDGYIFDIISGIHPMLNVSIKDQSFPLIILMMVTMGPGLGYNTYNHPRASVNGIVIP